jgi:hypothetical protein
VLVEPGWLSGIRDLFQGGDVDLVGGKVLPLFRGRVPGWLQLYRGATFGRLASPLGLLDYGPDRQPLGTRTALGANLAVRREVFEAVGGFSASLGKLRGTLLSGEDALLCARVQSAGYRACYEPAVVVRHVVPRSRLTLTYFLRWFFWSGITHARLGEGCAPGAATLLGVPRYLLRDLVESIVVAVGAAVTAAWPAAAVRATRAAFAAGYIRAAWAGGRRAGQRAEVRGGAEAA